MTRGSAAPILAFVLLVVAACGPAATAPSPTSAPSTGSAPEASSPGVSPATAWLADLVGTWDGALADPTSTYPGRLTLGDCSSTTDPCGELEYLGPDGTVLCASDLTPTGANEDRLMLAETLVYQGWNCFPTTLHLAPPVRDRLDVEQYVDASEPCCRGTFDRIAAGPVDDPLPELWEVPGVGRATSVVALGGTGTQYADATDDALWMPLGNTGQVARVDATSGAVVGTTFVGDPATAGDAHIDPYGVVVGDDGAIWVAQAAAGALARLGPDGTIESTIDLGVTPYALAIDGASVWATSFEDDVVVQVDPAKGEVVARIPVAKPTGIAAGAGAVWVVLHRDDAVARIDPTMGTVVTTIALGERGPDPGCGHCAENVVVADDIVWVAGNAARSVFLIDPVSDAVRDTIELPYRVWSVAAGSGAIWASQFDDTGGGGTVTEAGSKGIVRIDPTTLETVTADVPVFSVSWGVDALWGLGVGRRGDVLYRIEPGTGG